MKKNLQHDFLIVSMMNIKLFKLFKFNYIIIINSNVINIATSAFNAVQ